jgi:exodeoxyribonuclease VII large subunit
VQALRQVVDEYQKALTLAACECIRRRDRILRDLACRLDLLGPAALLRRRREALVALEARLAGASGKRLRQAHDRVGALALRLTAADPRHRLQLAAARLDQSAQRLHRAVDAKRTQTSLRVEALAAHLEAINPRRVLQRGYSITTRRRDGKILRAATDVKPGDRIVTHLAEGEISSTVDDTNQLPLFE